MANFSEYTRHLNGKVATNRSGKTFLTLRKKLDLKPANGDIFVKVTEDIVKRPDLVAYKAYGNAELWWVIYEYNEIKDPLFDLKANQTLRIPELSRVLLALENTE